MSKDKKEKDAVSRRSEEIVATLYGLTHIPWDFNKDQSVAYTRIFREEDVGQVEQILHENGIKSLTNYERRTGNALVKIKFNNVDEVEKLKEAFDEQRQSGMRP